MFLFPNQQENFEYLLQRDGTHYADVERMALFYILSGNEERMSRIDELYDFEERMIRVNDDNHWVSFSSGAKALVLLGYNLYNNYPCGTVMDIFHNLDEKNCELALKGIQIRMGMSIRKKK